MKFLGILAVFGLVFAGCGKPDAPPAALIVHEAASALPAKAQEKQQRIAQFFAARKQRQILRFENVIDAFD